jgi:Protein of unknown function (DUF3465)
MTLISKYQFPLIAALLVLSGLTACADRHDATPISQTLTNSSAMAQQPYGSAQQVQDYGQDQVIAAQDQHAIKQQVTFTAPVKKLLPDDRQGSKHQKFLLALDNGSTILVAHNIDLAPYLPIQPGTIINISGEYIWNRKGGLVHFTHHATRRGHMGGWVEVGGQRYE